MMPESRLVPNEAGNAPGGLERPKASRMSAGPSDADPCRGSDSGWRRWIREVASEAWRAFERDWLGADQGDETEASDAVAGPPVRASIGGGTCCRRCGGTIGPGEASSPCVACLGRAGIADGVVRLGEFSGELRRRILDLKYGGRPEAAEDLGRELAEEIARRGGPIDVAATLVIPVPGASWRVWHRGVDHAAELGREVARRLQVPHLKVLAHLGTPPRSGRMPGDRGGRSLRIRRGWGPGALERLRVLLVDDVLTTGTTLREAVRCLRPLRPREIHACVVAVAPDPRRAKGLGGGR